jgi:hypothetical protein
VLYHIPESLTAATLIPNSELHPLIHTNKIKAFKIVQTADNRRKLIGYLESWDDLNKIIGKQVTWDGIQLDWCRHSTLSALNELRKNTRPKNKSGPRITSENERSNGNKNVATGINRYLLGIRRNQVRIRRKKRRKIGTTLDQRFPPSPRSILGEPYMQS